jgi:septum formation protein
LINHSLVLASTSEIRRKLASNFDSSIIFSSPSADEDHLKEALKGLEPAQLCYELAKAKSLSINHDFPNHLVLGCDQICLLENKIFSKPRTAERAIGQLKELSGKTHHLIGQYVFSKDNAVIHEVEIICTMNMRELSLNEIQNYVKLDQPFFACGAYKYEENGHQLFSEVKGSLEAINGLPLSEILKGFNQNV